MKENPLFLIARDKHRERINEGGFEMLANNNNNINTFTLGFCDGVAYSTGIFQKQIASLQEQINSMQKP